MKRRQRLRRRIVRSTALVSAVAMAAMIGTVVLALSAVTRNSVDSTLDDRFDVISAAIASSSKDPTTSIETPDDAIDDSTWLYGPSGSVIDGPRAGARVQAVADGLGDVTSRTRVVRGDRVFLAAPVTIGARAKASGVLIVSESLGPYESTRAELIIGLTLLGLLVTAGATAIAAWTVSRSLEPVESMADLAEDWSQHQLDARFDDRGADDEINHLGRTLNVLLDRVAGALRGEQRLTSELAHELRTPLTAIRGEAELAGLESVDDGTRERLERVVALTDRMSETITALLDIARSATLTSDRTTTVGAVVDGVFGHRPPAPDGIELAVLLGSSRDVALAATTELAVRALAPLGDNAVRHTRTRVDVTAQVHDRAVTITVSDDGPGVPDSDPELLFVAGVRVSDVAHGEGAGLGLSLSRRAARSLGGDAVVVSTRDPTSFALSLPRP